MRILFTFYLKDDEQKKTSVKEGNNYSECKNKLLEQYPEAKIENSDNIENASDTPLTGGYLLSLSK